MKRNEKARIYSLIAAVCFLMIGIEAVISTVQVYQWGILSIYYIITNALFFLLNMLFAALLMYGKKNIGLVIVAFFQCIYSFIFSNQFFLPYSAFFVLLLVHCLSAVRLNKKASKYIWFIPSCLFVVSCVFIWIEYEGAISIKYVWRSMLMQCVVTLSCFFSGLWLKNSFVEEKSD